jgi:hypothetical protein
MLFSYKKIFSEELLDIVYSRVFFMTQTVNSAYINMMFPK